MALGGWHLRQNDIVMLPLGGVDMATIKDNVFFLLIIFIFNICKLPTQLVHIYSHFHFILF